MRGVPKSCAACLPRALVCLIPSLSLRERLSSSDIVRRRISVVRKALSRMAWIKINRRVGRMASMSTDNTNVPSVKLTKLVLKICLCMANWSGEEGGGDGEEDREGARWREVGRSVGEEKTAGS